MKNSLLCKRKHQQFIFVITAAMLWLFGCSGVQNETQFVKDYLRAFYDQDAENVLKMTDPYQRSPRIDFHIKEFVSDWSTGKFVPEQWQINIIGKSDTTVRFRCIQQGTGVFLEIVKREGKWYAASIYGPIQHPDWRGVKYFRGWGPDNDFPRYTTVFGIDADIDSSGEKRRRNFIEKAQQEMEAARGKK